MLVRDSHVACDFDFRRTSMLRCYGQLQFFISVMISDSKLHLAYADWYKMEESEAEVAWVYQEFSRNPNLQHFVPVSYICTMIALLPMLKCKKKRTILELL